MGALARRLGRWLMGGQRRRRFYRAANKFGVVVLGGRIRTGPAKGLRFVGGDTVGYVLGISEPPVQRALVAHLSEGDVLYDVGSHAGFPAVLGCRLVGPTGGVHCFEPVPANTALLRRNMEANGFRNVTVHELALSDIDGTAAMAVGTKGITAHFEDRGEFTARTARLDSLDLKPPTVVKIDVEGAETKVLQGMQNTLRDHRPVLVVEIHGNQEAPVRHVLDAAGYTTVHRLDDGGMPHLLASP